MKNNEHIQPPNSGFAVRAETLMSDKGPHLKGEVFIQGHVSGTPIIDIHIPNVITYDAGILAARLFRNSLSPNPAAHNGLNMLAVGSGATGSLLAPDAPQKGQRRLNSELARKAFSSVTFRDSDGVAVAYPTHVVDFYTVFTESEAVGPWNEMGLVATASPNPLVTNPIVNGPTDYDPTIDVTGKDLFANYLTFPVFSKTLNMVLGVTWRLTF
jgi:hypothetical protein